MLLHYIGDIFSIESFYIRLVGGRDTQCLKLELKIMNH